MSQKIAQGLDKKEYLTFSAILVIVVLFLIDVATLMRVPDSHIVYIDICLYICSLIFFLELCANVFCRPQMSWVVVVLEILGTVSIFLDVSVVSRWLGQLG